MSEFIATVYLLNSLIFCPRGWAFDSLFCAQGRVFVHNDCPRGGGFLLPSRCVLGGMVMDEIDTCTNLTKSTYWGRALIEREYFIMWQDCKNLNKSQFGSAITRIFSKRFTSGGFLTIDHCSRTIHLCLHHCFLQIL